MNLKDPHSASRAIQPDQKIHRWTIISAAPPALTPQGRYRLRWLCRCVCGTEKVVLDQSLRLAQRASVGGSRSCGCLVDERITKHGNNRGQRPTAEYRAWLSAKKRCNNPRNPSFPRYGGRGIKICDRWSSDFWAFLSDMGSKSDPSLSLDRIDPDGDYHPGNCRWAPSNVQSRNKNGIRWYEFEGQPALLGDIAAFFCISRDKAKGAVRRGALPVRPLAIAPRVPDCLAPLVLDLNLVEPLGIQSIASTEKGLVILA